MTRKLYQESQTEQTLTEKLLKGTYSQARRRRQVRHRDAYLLPGHHQLQIDWLTDSSIGLTGPDASGVLVGGPWVRTPKRFRLPTGNL